MRVRLIVLFILLTARASFAFAFDVYFETNFKNQPDFAKYGAKNLSMMYAGNMWGKGKNKDRKILPPKDRTITHVQQNFKDYTGLLVLDIESWGLRGSGEELINNVKKYLTVLDWVKSAAPKAKVGYYARPPVSEYSAMQKGTTHPRYLKWQAQNDKLAPLADAVDAFFPECYTNTFHQHGWVNKCVGLINESRRLDKSKEKKVYPFIKPEYHSSGKLAFQPVPEDYFLLQLQTLKKHADGVVIWEGSRRPWNEKEPWWQATLKFLGSK